MRNILSRIGILILVTEVISCANKQAAPQAPPPVAVGVQIAQTGSATYFDLYPATVTALNQVDIKPQVSGNITGIFFKDGQAIRKGMKLYEIDQQQYKAAYEQAIANVHVAEANESKAQQDADRYTDLAKNDAIAKQTLDHAVADLESSKKQVEAAKANVASVETNLKYSIISAPFDGTIGISLVKIGTAVYPQSLLNTVSSDDPMAVDFAIDQSEIPRFTQYLNGGAKDRDSIFTLVLPDGSIYTNPGHLALLDRAVDPQTGTIKARLVFSNNKKILKPGITTNVRVKHNAGENSLLIPFKAVVEQLGEYFVYTVSNGHAKQHKVALGTRINANIIVRSGVMVGDSVVTEGVQKLRDSVAVKAGPGPGQAKQ
ncbi:MAG TPA: efflux RND transporter periplasmic adaptor subunit [Puia sp.]|nr:efflux RND transporter periplasmic adaptor subunit [Puia sp.]